MPPKAEKKGGARRKGRKIKLCKSSSQYEEKQKEEVLKTAMVMSLAVPDTNFEIELKKKKLLKMKLDKEIEELERQEKYNSLSFPVSVSNKYTDKMTLITKPEQSGKTFVMFEEIIINFQEEPRRDKKQNINIIVCDNSLLQVNQTCYRMENHSILQEVTATSSGKTYIQLSSTAIRKEKKNEKTGKTTKESGAQDIDQVVSHIVTHNVRNATMCAHHRRSKDIYDLIEQMEGKESIVKGKFHYTIWFDEADKFVKYIEKDLIPLLNNMNCVDLKMLTATATRIIKKWEGLNVFPLENPTLDNYQGWDDNNIIIETYNDNRNTEYIEYILDKYSSEIKPNTKWFIPAEFLKESHFDVKDICSNYNFATIVINGDGIFIYTPDIEDPIEIIEKKERDLSEFLLELYKKHNLSRFPIAITGYDCIQRGITISSENFMLTHGIMPCSINNSDSGRAFVSQIAGRMKGNQKYWKKFKPSTVYCTENFSTIAKELEELSKCIALTAYKDPDFKLTKTFLKEKPTKKTQTLSIEKKKQNSIIVNTQDEALQILRKRGINARNRSTTAPKTLLQEDGSNPTFDHVLKRWWGLRDDAPCRAVPLNDNRWIVYWIPEKEKCFTPFRRK